MGSYAVLRGTKCFTAPIKGSKGDLYDAIGACTLGELELLPSGAPSVKPSTAGATVRKALERYGDHYGPRSVGRPLVRPTASEVAKRAACLFGRPVVFVDGSNRVVRQFWPRATRDGRPDPPATSVSRFPDAVGRPDLAHTTPIVVRATALGRWEPRVGRSAESAPDTGEPPGSGAASESGREVSFQGHTPAVVCAGQRAHDLKHAEWALRLPAQDPGGASAACDSKHVDAVTRERLSCAALLASSAPAVRRVLIGSAPHFADMLRRTIECRPLAVLVRELRSSADSKTLGFAGAAVPAASESLLYFAGGKPSDTERLRSWQQHCLDHLRLFEEVSMQDTDTAAAVGWALSYLGPAIRPSGDTLSQSLEYVSEIRLRVADICLLSSLRERHRVLLKGLQLNKSSALPKDVQLKQHQLYLAVEKCMTEPSNAVAVLHAKRYVSRVDAADLGDAGLLRMLLHARQVAYLTGAPPVLGGDFAESYSAERRRSDRERGRQKQVVRHEPSGERSPVLRLEHPAAQQQLDARYASLDSVRYDDADKGLGVNPAVLHPVSAAGVRSLQDRGYAVLGQNPLGGVVVRDRVYRGRQKPLLAPSVPGAQTSSVAGPARSESGVMAEGWAMFPFVADRVLLFARSPPGNVPLSAATAEFLRSEATRGENFGSSGARLVASWCTGLAVGVPSAELSPECRRFATSPGEFRDMSVYLTSDRRAWMETALRADVQARLVDAAQALGAVFESLPGDSERVWEQRPLSMGEVRSEARALCQRLYEMCEMSFVYIAAADHAVTAPSSYAFGDDPAGPRFVLAERLYAAGRGLYWARYHTYARNPGGGAPASGSAAARSLVRSRRWSAICELHFDAFCGGRAQPRGRATAIDRLFAACVEAKRKRGSSRGDDDYLRRMAARHISVLRLGTELHRQSFQEPSRTSTGSREDDGVFSFFALEEAYGSDDTYGPIRSVWTLRRDLRLLNISTTDSRAYLAEWLGIDPETISCRLQYGGGPDNRRVHHLLYPALEKLRLDGTIIREIDADSDCDGSTEVVVLQDVLENALEFRRTPSPPAAPAAAGAADDDDDVLVVGEDEGELVREYNFSSPAGVRDVSEAVHAIRRASRGTGSGLSVEYYTNARLRAIATMEGYFLTQGMKVRAERSGNWPFVVKTVTGVPCFGSGESGGHIFGKLISLLVSHYMADANTVQFALGLLVAMAPVSAYANINLPRMYWYTGERFGFRLYMTALAAQGNLPIGEFVVGVGGAPLGITIRTSRPGDATAPFFLQQSMPRG